MSGPRLNLLTPEIEQKVQSGIIAAIGRKEYHQASRQISEILAELHASIPDRKRVSYGIVYTIKALSETLYTQLARTGAPIHEVAGVLFEESDDAKAKCVALGIMSFYGLGDLARRLPDAIHELVGELVASDDANSYWIAYRACRNLVKEDPVKVMNLLRVDEYRYKTRTYRNGQRTAWQPCCFG